MTIKFDDGPLKCESCGDEAIGEHDLYLGDSQPEAMQGGRVSIFGMTAYAEGDPILTSSLFYPATALCTYCLLMKVRTVDGPWHNVSARGQS